MPLHETLYIPLSLPHRVKARVSAVKSAVIPARVGIRINLGPNTTLLVRILDSRLCGNDGNME